MTDYAKYRVPCETRTAKEQAEKTKRAASWRNTSGLYRKADHRQRPHNASMGVRS